MNRKMAVLLTCHNRKQLTLRCLEEIYSQDIGQQSIEIYLVDDGSTDGTTVEVLAKYPEVNLILGDGQLYWGGGMRRAMEAATENSHEFYVWLNDDTILYRDTIRRLLDCYSIIARAEKKPCIVVGATRDAESFEITYGGMARNHKRRPLAFSLISPGERPIACDTMNGNCVFIPKGVIDSIGNIDDSFVHSMGDLDYGLRASAAGLGIWLMPGYAGTCSRNSVCGSFKDSSLPWMKRYRLMFQITGLPVEQWRKFAKRHAGFFWPVHWVWPYLSILVDAMTVGLRGKDR